MEYSAKNNYAMGLYVCNLVTRDSERKKMVENIKSIFDNYLYEGLIKNYIISNFGDELSFDCHNFVEKPDLNYTFTNCYRIDTITDLFYEKVDPMNECSDCNLHGIDVKAITLVSSSYISKQTISREMLYSYWPSTNICRSARGSGKW